MAVSPATPPETPALSTTMPAMADGRALRLPDSSVRGPRALLTCLRRMKIHSWVLARRCAELAFRLSRRLDGAHESICVTTAYALVGREIDTHHQVPPRAGAEADTAAQESYTTTCGSVGTAVRSAAIVALRAFSTLAI